MTTKYVVQRAKTGRSGCKGCKLKIEKDEVRIGKETANPFGSDEDSVMTAWYHVPCMFQAQRRARKNIIEGASDMEGFADLDDEGKDKVREHLRPFLKEMEERAAKKGSGGGGASSSAAGSKKAAAASPRKPKAPLAGQMTLSFSGKLNAPAAAPAAAAAAAAAGDGDDSDKAAAAMSAPLPSSDSKHPDNLFKSYRELCDEIADEPSHLAKTALVKRFITKGTSGSGFQGNTFLVLKLLLPSYPKRVYNIKDKQMVKCFSNIFHLSADEMTADLDNGDCPETVRKFFEKSRGTKPADSSTITLEEVDALLGRMETVTRMEDKEAVLRQVAARCTPMDLKYFVRLLKHDVRINAGPKNILAALDSDAYAAWQASNDLQDVVDRCKARSLDPSSLKRKLSVRSSLMTPVKPMLAEACKSFADALAKCPRGMLAEIKYDGERVQIHKKGDEFRYFSRSLKEVSLFADEIPKACPHGDSMILDCELLLIDKHGKPLPFGTLGKHKRKQFQDARPCLFLFDMLYFNGDSLMNHSIVERRKLMMSHITVVKRCIEYSEAHHITEENELRKLMQRVLDEGLEGLVLKGTHTVYEPGKRHWLKIKKDYLAEGAMADAADLVVLGAYYGTGTYGGIMSVFLMGCRDDQGHWRTVCKVGNGHDDATIRRINKELKVIKISKRPEKVPSWLVLSSNSLTPDFVVEDPKQAPVWEIVGAEFSKSKNHSADGVSIRFPRVKCIRHDKDWQSATSLDRLKQLARTSSGTTDINLVGRGGAAAAAKRRDADDEDEEDEEDEEDVEEEEEEEEEDEDEPSMPPAKRQRKRDACRYGANCYQKRPDHRRRFAHPGDEDWPKSHQDEEGDHADKLVAAARASRMQMDDDDEASEASAPPPRAAAAAAAEHDGEEEDDDDDDLGLPDIFDGLQIHVANGVSKRKTLLRHIVAFGGDVVDDIQTDATHVVVPDWDIDGWDDRTKAVVASNPAAEIVSPKWLLGCIKRKTLLPTAEFKA